MAKGRRRSNLQWYSNNGVIDGVVNASEELFQVDPSFDTEVQAGAEPIESGTMLTIFVRVSAAYQDGVQASGFNSHHVLGGLHVDEAVESAGALTVPSLDLGEPEGAGYEDILTLDSCIIWSRFDESSTFIDADKAGCMLKLHSKSKRRLEQNDFIFLDVANLPVGGGSPAGLDYAYDARILMKH